MSLLSKIFSCFLCDFHICKDCANSVSDEKKIENEKKIPTKIEKLQPVVVNQDEEEEGLLDVMEQTEETFKVQESEKNNPTKKETLQPFVVNQDEEEEELLDVMEQTEEAFKVQDDIPLIDENPSLDDLSLIVERIKVNRPKFLHQGNLQAGFYCNPLAEASPDIFQLRAPLVSCENILTPGISEELVRAKQI